MIVYTNLCPAPYQPDGLRQRIDHRIPGLAEYLYDLKDLGERLRAPVYDIDALVIHVCNASPISELLEYQQDLRELSIILVLNDGIDKGQLTQLLKLYPRYMAFDPDDDTILNLLENRINHNGSRLNRTDQGNGQEQHEKKKVS